MALKETKVGTIEPKVEGVAPVTQQKSAGSGKFDRTKALEDFKKSGEAVRAKYDEETKKLEGSMSDAVQFVIALGNPAKKSGRVERGNKLPSIQVVGYKMKALKDIEVPVAPLKKDPKHVMDFQDPTWVPVKAGTEFDLTLAEAGILASQVQYAGKFTGGGDIVELHVTISQARPVPLTVLKRPNAPIKDKIEPVAKKNEKGKYEVLPHYKDKFGYLYTTRSAGLSASRKSSGGDHRADLAAAFRTKMLKATR